MSVHFRVNSSKSDLVLSRTRQFADRFSILSDIPAEIDEAAVPRLQPAFKSKTEFLPFKALPKSVD